MHQSLTEDIREMFTEQVTYRELLWQMTRRDLLLRYKQTIMGFGWAVFMPLLNTLIFTIVFTRVAKLETDLPYPLFSYCGLVAWNFFASSLRFAVSSLTANMTLVTKVYFPREIFPFSSVLVSLVDMGVACIILVVMMVYYQVMPGHTIVALPLVLLVHFAFTTGMSLLLAMANVFYRDVKYLFEVVLMLWMFASAVVYPVKDVGGWLGVALQLNPMTPIIEGYRAVLLMNTWPEPRTFAMASAISLTTLAIGWVMFHRNEFRFAEIV